LPITVIRRPATKVADNGTYIALSLRVVAENTGPIVRLR